MAKNLSYSVAGNVLWEVLKAATKMSGLGFLTREYIERCAQFEKAAGLLETVSDESQLDKALAEIELLGPSGEAQVLEGFVSRISGRALKALGARAE